MANRSIEDMAESTSRLRSQQEIVEEMNAHTVEALAAVHKVMRGGNVVVTMIRSGGQFVVVVMLMLMPKTNYPRLDIFLRLVGKWCKHPA